MIGARLALLPPEGGPLDGCASALVLHPTAAADLPGFSPYSTTIMQPFKPAQDAWANRGYAVAPTASDDLRCDVALVCLPRSKVEAFALIAQAAQSASQVLIDGQKTDGVESVLKAVKTRHIPAGVISKAHGKLFWLTDVDSSTFADWAAGPALTDGGFWTAPGVFSADGIDPASAMLADVLPDRIGARVADLGAGWGFLSAHILTRPDVSHLDVVEAHHMALACAEHNITDNRAQFHWADATTWRPDTPVDAVVINPPFHTDRKPDPALGQAFIKAAARMLKPNGHLWMVANRHLPYEDVLSETFTKIVDLGGDARFKLLVAERPRKTRR
ncbi:MAG: class I SAM-dependent methyltransferase [Rhodobacteraceae bacterium]|nr:class I SAM-dependent methyltransferase [Paracoccaceae bacterium]